MADVKKSMGLGEWTLLIILSVVWGGSFFFVGVAVGALPPFTIAAARVALAAIVLTLVVRVVGLSIPKNGQLWAALAFMGLVNNAIPFSLIIWGQTQITSGLASILIAATPFFTVLVAHFLTKDEKITPARLVGLAIGFGGVVLIIGPNVMRELGADSLAQLAVLGAAVSYAFAGVFGRRFRRMGVTPVVTANGQLIASTAMLIPLALLVDRPWTLPMPGLEIWGAVLGLALFSTALAYMLYFRILATAGATNAALVAFLIPVSAILLGTLLLGEALDPRHLAGMGLLGVGLAVIDGRLFGSLRRRWAAKPPEAQLPDISG